MKSFFSDPVVVGKLANSANGCQDVVLIVDQAVGGDFNVVGA